VRNSILFPGVHVMAGAEICDSIIFFDNIIHRGVQLNRVVSDVNTVYNRNVQVGSVECEAPKRVTVIGWNNSIPEGFAIGCGCRVNPRIAVDRWPKNNRLADGEEL
jgi:glucose-1-phosphate adenylyltransferase